jgi:hypothetical protein
MRVRAHENKIGPQGRRGKALFSTSAKTRRYDAGMDAFTIVHVVVSLIGILSGLVVLCGLFTANRMCGWTMLFLVTTVATSVTGFGFPYHGFTPAIILGILSLSVLTAAIAARYAFHLAGSWRWIYVVGAVVALYFNVFVLVVQLFLKVPALHALAPKGSEPPFAIAQGIVLVLFILAGIKAVRQFHPVTT